MPGAIGLDVAIAFSAEGARLAADQAANPL